MLLSFFLAGVVNVFLSDMKWKFVATDMINSYEGAHHDVGLLS